MHWKSVVKVLLSLGLLFGLIAYADHHRLWASIKSADSKLLVASFILSPLQGVFESGRLKIVFGSFCLSYVDSVRLFFMGMFFGNFMPGAIGTDLYQIYHMHTIRPGLLRPASLSIFLRLNGLFVNLLLAAGAVSLGTSAWVGALEIDQDYLVFPVWAMLILLFLGMLLTVVIATSQGRRQVRLLYLKLQVLFREFLASVRSFRVSQHIRLTVLGVLVVLSRVAVVYILVRAFGLAIGALDMVFIVTVTTLAALLPIGVGGLGVREVSLTALLIAYGVAPSDAVAVSLVGRCFIWVISSVGGAIFLLERTRSKTGS